MKPRKLSIETLEERRMLAVLTVQNNLDDSLANLAGDGELSLREAIELANTPGMVIDGFVSNEAEDTIEFASSLEGETICLSQGELVLTSATTIHGLGQELLAIDAQGSSRVLHFQAADADLTISDLTLRGGRTTADSQDLELAQNGGGAVRSTSTGQVLIINSLLSDNGTEGDYSHGGAVFSIGNVAIQNTTFRNNTVSGFSAGGGAVTGKGAIHLMDSQVSFNSTEGDFSYGGGIYGLSEVVITSSVIQENHTVGRVGSGGGFFAQSGLTLIDSTVSGNYTLGDDSNGGGGVAFGEAHVKESTISRNYIGGGSAAGGGIAFYGHASVEDSTIDSNRTLGDSSAGGAIFWRSSVITSSTVSNNSSFGNAGGLLLVGPAVIQRTTISGNVVLSSQGRGGGIRSLDSLFLCNSTVVDNRTSSEGDVRSGAGIYQDFVVNDLILENSILSGNLSGIETNDNLLNPNPLVAHVVEAQNSLLGTDVSQYLAFHPSSGNVISDSPLLTPLQDNGGPTLTHAPLPGSPALNAGDPATMAGVGDVPISDQRGGLFTRVYDGRIDVGAVELQPLHADIDGDGDIDGRDFLIWQRGFGSSPAVFGDGDADGDKDVDIDDLAAWQNEYGALSPQLPAGELASAAWLTGLRLEPSGVVATKSREELPHAQVVDSAFAVLAVSTPTESARITTASSASRPVVREQPAAELGLGDVFEQTYEDRKPHHYRRSPGRRLADCYAPRGLAAVDAYGPEDSPP